jgi:hypothetical protein
MSGFNKKSGNRFTSLRFRVACLLNKPSKLYFNKTFLKCFSPHSCFLPKQSVYFVSVLGRNEGFVTEEI